ncbi:MAG: 1,4-beta-xylanase, partial [Sphingobacteriales bacterium]
MSGTGIASAQKNKKEPGKIWSVEKANEWYKTHKWLTGANYIPANAINQLEMWQADTFSPDVIDKELGWAEGLGFNTLRVFLYSKAYKQDPEGFLKRVDQFLTITEKHKITPMFVFFDDCWNKTSEIGKQPAPKMGIHNSGWLQDPGDPASKEAANFADLEVYVKAVLTRFANDKRILLWDLYNEPTNGGLGRTSLPLLRKVFGWARAVNPCQPITVGQWIRNSPALNELIATNSDVVTFHCYDELPKLMAYITELGQAQRPLICTEWLNRSRNSVPETILPYFKQQRIGSLHWGLVNGKTQTHLPWGHRPGDPEPTVWQHDLYRPDRTPYRPAELDLFRTLINQA